MPISTLTSRGQVTIPKEIRSRMALRPGPAGVSHRRPGSRHGVARRRAHLSPSARHAPPVREGAAGHGRGDARGRTAGRCGEVRPRGDDRARHQPPGAIPDPGGRRPGGAVDDSRRAHRGLHALRRHCVALCELGWVLKWAYGCPGGDRRGPARAPHEEPSQIHTGRPRSGPWTSLKRGKGDFSDCLLGETGRALGAETTFTFDRG